MKRSPEEMLAEFHRLYDIFEAIEDAVHNQDGTYWTAGFGRLIHSRTTQLDRVAKGEFPPGEIVLGTRQAIRGTTDQLVGLLQDDPATGEKALATYRARTGRDYWDDVEPPKKLLAIILKRGRIRDAAEHRWLHGRLADAKSPLRAAEAALAQRILAEFEGSISPKDSA